MKKSKKILIIILGGLAITQAKADLKVHQCRDKNGAMEFTDKECPKKKKEISIRLMKNSNKQYVRTQKETDRYEEINNTPDPYRKVRRTNPDAIAINQKYDQLNRDAAWHNPGGKDEAWKRYVIESNERQRRAELNQ